MGVVSVSPNNRVWKTDQPDQVEVFSAYFNVTWPSPLYEREQGTSIYQSFVENRTALIHEIRERILEYYPDESMSIKVFYRERSVEIAVILLGAYTAVKDYTDLRAGVISIVEDLGKVIRRFFQNKMPGAQQGANAYDVVSRWKPGSAFYLVEGEPLIATPTQESAQQATPDSQPQRSELSIESHVPRESAGRPEPQASGIRGAQSLLLVYLVLSNLALIGFLGYLLVTRL
jgi:hypothetical protein